MIDPNVTVESLNAMGKGNMVEYLGIEFTEVNSDSITAKMPVDHRTKQPMGLLHGGASVVLAETIGSVASNVCIDSQQQYCVGLDINANHLKAVTDGYVYGTAKALHMGRRTHVWEIRISNEQEQLVCISRLTMAVVDK
uniref:Hotdog fold thioesterase n=1 Tax=Roseihalotalea indica TaxID=2867963 RepID=A0AA49GS00_9BACT|nr:hotdog fold thioesterase [Tunicatimonas sp. TK19036]